MDNKIKRILILGSGAREHAVTRAFAHSPSTLQLFCCGNTRNPGIQALTQDYAVIDITNTIEVLTYAKRWQADLVFIGPETPLEKGVTDLLVENNIAVIGPKQTLARIETDKSFARELMRKYNIPGSPRFAQFDSLSEVLSYVTTLGEGNYVVKANGLMSGKGVKISGEHLHSPTDTLNFCQQIFNSNQTVVIEEKLVGEEFSLMCFYDGKTMLGMPIVQDHKRAFMDDLGPNTGGMGSYSDANHSLPFLHEEDAHQALEINRMVLEALQQECNAIYRGILYGSFIATQTGVQVIEFNARFGDPEALNVLSVLRTDFMSICEAIVQQRLHLIDLDFAPLATVCKYLVPHGYPDRPETELEIGVDNISNADNLYFAAVNFANNKLTTTASRTAAFVGVAPSLREAERQAEQEISRVRGNLMHRADIGTQPLIQKRIHHMRQLRKLL